MRKLKVSLAATLYLLTASAYGQENRVVNAFHCASISNDIARLECFDKAYSDYRAAAETPGNWKVQTETNPLNDSLTTLIALSAESGAEPPYGHPYRFVIRCKGRTMEAWVAWHSFVGKDGSPVTWRIGSDSAQTERWQPSTNGAATFYPGNAELFVRSLLKADQLVVQVSPDFGAKKMAIFNIKGLDQAVKPIKKTCLPEREELDLLMMESNSKYGN